MRKARAFLFGAIGSFVDSRCGLHAAGLTYFSLLAFVPVLCLSLLLAKVCGVGDIARSEINRHLDAYITQMETVHDEPSIAIALTEKQREQKREVAKALALQARSVSDKLFDRAARFDVSTLGWIGLVMLAWTVVSTFGMVETSMNEIWNVKKMRPLWKRSVLYLLVTFIAPLLAAIALSMPILNLIKHVLESAAGYIPYSKWFMELLVSILFSKVIAFVVTFGFSSLVFGFFYKFMPYCKVETRWALLSGAIVALVFGLWLKVCIIAQVGVANTSALYGSFAFFPILLAWIYISWQIILSGSVLSYQMQTVFSSKN